MKIKPQTVPGNGKTGDDGGLNLPTRVVLRTGNSDDKDVACIWTCYCFKCLLALPKREGFASDLAKSDDI